MLAGLLSQVLVMKTPSLKSPRQLKIYRKEERLWSRIEINMKTECLEKVKVYQVMELYLIFLIHTWSYEAMKYLCEVLDHSRI